VRGLFASCLRSFFTGFGGLFRVRCFGVRGRGFLLLFLSKKEVHRVSRFYFERTLRIISYLIFFVAAMLYIIWRFVIYFFSMFLFVLSLRVWTTFES